MSSRESLPVPFFGWRALYAERAEAFSRIISDVAARGGFILQGEVDTFEIGLEASNGAAWSGRAGAPSRWACVRSAGSSWTSRKAP
jgi:hypothetical protein